MSWMQCHLEAISSQMLKSPDKLEAFEMWLYRRLLRISWKEHKTNGEVLHKMKTKRSLLITFKKRKCQYFGHIIRGNGVQAEPYVNVNHHHSSS